MAQDAFGNYIAGLDSLIVDPAGSSGGGGLSGAGAPDDSLGSNGDIYVNITNGDVYSKSGDTWTIVGGSGGVSETGTGSPEGVVTADIGTIYLRTDTDSLFYKKTGSGNTGWIALIGA